MEYAKQLALTAPLLVAADGGARHLAVMGVKPHAIVGDMDSLAGDLWQNDPTITRIVYPTDKNRSDTELAIEWAFKQGMEKVLLLGALGGRMGHLLGHCAILARYPDRVALIDEHLFLQAVNSGHRIVLHMDTNDRISIFAVSGDPQLKTKGLKYELNDERLEFATHGLDNLAVQNECSIQVRDGFILLCVEKENP